MKSQIELIMKALTLLDKETLELVGKTVEKAGEKIKSSYGFIHKRTEAVVNGKKGFLIWDYILYNEISFQDEDGNIIPFYHSVDDALTEVEWYKLEEKYGIK